MKKIFSIFICMALLLTVGFSMISCDFFPEKGANQNDKEHTDPIDQNAKDYADALAFLDTGKYVEAKALFEKLGDYKDSEEYLSKFYYMPISFEYDLIGKKSTNYVEYNSQNLPASEATVREDVNAVAEFVYDESGTILKQIMTNHTTGTVVSYSYTYDSNGKRIGAVYSDQSGTVASHVFEYDSNGNLVKETYTGADGLVYVYASTYDENGNIISQEGSYDGMTYYSLDVSYATDANGRVIREVCTYSDGSQESLDYTYDEMGNRIKSVYTDFEGLQTCYEYTYDSNGNVLKEVCTDPDGVVQYVKTEYVLLYIPTGITEGTRLFFIDFWSTRL